MLQSEIFERCGFNPNPSQNQAIQHTKGPLLIIAGPGSGKTEVLIHRTLNLLILHDVDPQNILLCTFTEKAAEQLKTRLKLYLSKCNREDIDLTKMSVGTINSICNNLLQSNINEIPHLHKNYDVLEELTQKLFLYEHFWEIFHGQVEGKYLSKWHGVWNTINRATFYFNKITEECIDPLSLQNDADEFLSRLSDAYIRYKEKLEDKNLIDFSFQQKHILDLLTNNEHVSDKLQKQFQYIMVDEYQDTNYVQERIMLSLAEPQNNMCVVGDDDQALYRFRGATVRNILEFMDNFTKEGCSQVKLDINYRSHKDIISLYNDFMDNPVWNDNGTLKYRYHKRIKHNENDTDTKLDYPSVVDILDEENAPEKVANLLLYLKESNIIKDYNQVAFFMRSIAYDNIMPFIEEFEKKGIDYYAPRAKKYFENQEVLEMIGCFVQLFFYTGAELKFRDAFERILNYCLKANEFLQAQYEKERNYKNLSQFLNTTFEKIKYLEGNETLEDGAIDLFYRILSYHPFSSYLNDEVKARNLSIFSRLLMLFQQYYHYEVITAKNKAKMAHDLFSSYLRFLYQAGVGEYEDRYDIFPSGKVQLMTIHQAKGLEFPVVVVAGLEKRNPPKENIDQILGPYYHREEFEPYQRITDFDQMRLHYVAFSRAQNLLVLVSRKKPFKYYREIFEKVEDYDEANIEDWQKIKVKAKEKKALKLEYGFTSHINVYDICPKQYLMYKEYEFTPARAAQRIFGSLIHQTIEDIHRHVIEKNPEELDEEKVLEYFEINKRGFIKKGVHPFNEEAARDHVLNYFRNNKDMISKVQETEYEVVLEKSDYYLKGILDLIRGEDGKIDILDFKAQSRPDPENSALECYRRQLAVYSYIVKEKKGIEPARTIIYWTGEEEKALAIMEINISEEIVNNVVDHFDKVVHKIRNKEFDVSKKPDKKVCRECDFRHCCMVDSTSPVI